MKKKKNKDIKKNKPKSKETNRNTIPTIRPSDIDLVYSDGIGPLK